MANLIDKYYFWGSLAIAGINLSSYCNNGLQSSTKDNKVQELENYIQKFEPIFIKKVFGTHIYDTLPESYKSMLFDDNTKVSPFANFIYYLYTRDTAVMTTNVGMKTSQIANSRSMSPSCKMVNAWNEMVEMLGRIHTELYEAEITDGITYLTDILPYIKTTDDIYEPINVWNI